MSDVFTSAGTVIAVSASLPATYDDTGFTALTFTDVAEVTDLGEFGRSYNLVTHNPLATRGTVKRKGSYNDGAVTMQLGRTPSDAGQVIMVAAVDDDASHSFKVTLQDGTIQYFTAQVMSYTTNVGSADQIVTSSTTLELDDAVVEV